MQKNENAVMVEMSRRLRKVLLYREMTSADLCRITGLGSGQISNYLNAHQCPRCDRLRLICDTLDVSADYLLGMSDHFGRHK